MSASFLCLYGHIEGRRSRFLGVILVSPLDTPTCTAAHRVHSLGDARVQVGGLDAVRRARPARRGGGCVQPRVQWGGGRGGGGGSLFHRQQRVAGFHRGRLAHADDDRAPRHLPRSRYLVWIKGHRADHYSHCAREARGDKEVSVQRLAGAWVGHVRGGGQPSNVVKRCIYSLGYSQT
jgi:hypothetical protein